MLNLIPNDIPLDVVKTDSASSLNMDVFSEHSANRDKVEAFIKAGFMKTFGANISVTMPFLLSVSEGKLKAALGIRPATSGLFIEQYLDKPIERLSFFLSHHANREDIVEIGNLYSNSNRFTIPLFLVTAVSLFCLNFRFMAFSGTNKVIDLINKAGIDYEYICEATPGQLENSIDEWGSYYETKPIVVVVSLAQVMQVIEANAFYGKLFKGLSQKIYHVCKCLEDCK